MLGFSAASVISTERRNFFLVRSALYQAPLAFVISFFNPLDPLVV
jgi:hypothetical protein